MASSTEKVRENRLRQVAARRGMILEKSRRRDPQATDYGTYTLRDRKHRRLLATLASLEDVEAYLA